MVTSEMLNLHGTSFAFNRHLRSSNLHFSLVLHGQLVQAVVVRNAMLPLYTMLLLLGFMKFICLLFHQIGSPILMHMKAIFTFTLLPMIMVESTALLAFEIFNKINENGEFEVHTDSVSFHIGGPKCCLIWH